MEPLPPVKEVEYRCIIGKDFDEIMGQEYTTFSFETAKEFSSFRYEIAVRYKLEGSTIVFRVLGMTATRMMMPAFGTAQSVLKVPQLQPGKYTVTFVKSDSNASEFFLEVTKKGIQIIKPIPRKRFIDLIVRDDAAAHTPKAIITTVSKTPHAPLVPRTIQKRPQPPTPEELEILAALRDETPEERDAREEMELFGKKRAAKKEKANAAAKAKPAKKTAPAAAKHASAKKTAVKPKVKAKAKPAPKAKSAKTNSKKKKK
ncbi:MAG: hypothetical protein JSS75_02840 [Bacteroidetes bacterium]|nr:hypothetical protein [Bacteroidota bacterium]